MNRVVLVTGSSRGIGKAIIEEFAKEGYNVIINYNNSQDEALALQKEIERFNVESMVVKCDISHEEEIDEMIAEVISKFGRIDVLVNNAALENNSEFSQKTKESFRNILDVNLIGTFLMSKKVSEYMIANKSGKIINISSNNSINKYDATTVEYDVSKAGINILTKVMAKEFAPYINVNAVAPGWVLTEKNKTLDEELDGHFVKSESENIYLGRFARPEEIAKVVLFLASDDAKYINGEIIVADGGC